MKKLEKYKIALPTKFVKFKVKHFVEIPTIRHDKAVPPCLTAQNHLPLLNVFPPWLLKFSSCPPCLADDTKIIPPLIPGGQDTMQHGQFSRAVTFSGQLDFWRRNLFRIKKSTTELHFQNRYFCIASTFLEQVLFQQRYEFKRGTFSEQLLFENS